MTDALPPELAPQPPPGRRPRRGSVWADWLGALCAIVFGFDLMAQALTGSDVDPLVILLAGVTFILYGARLFLNAKGHELTSEALALNDYTLKLLTIQMQLSGYYRLCAMKGEQPSPDTIDIFYDRIKVANREAVAKGVVHKEES